MSNPNISATLSSADMANIRAHASAIVAVLVFLVNLTPAERKRLRKMGIKRQGYVKDVYSGAINNSGDIPSSFDLNEYTKDMNLYAALRQVRDILGPILESIDDTLLLIGHELMKQSDQCYGFLQTSAKGNSALNELVSQIATAFANKRISMQSVSIGEGGTLTLSKVDIRKPLVNSGDTIISYRKVGELPSTAQTLNPSSSVKLPKDFKNVVIVNLSNSGKAEITYKLKP